MTTKFFNTFKILALALVLSFGLSYVYAWTAPTATPPNGNVSAPLNTSATAQTKEGSLKIGGIDLGGKNITNVWNFVGNTVLTNSLTVALPVEKYTYTRGAISTTISPKCSCDTSTSSTNCSSTFTTDSDQGVSCYDQYRTVTARAYQYTRSETQIPPPSLTVDTGTTGNVGIGVTTPAEKLSVAGIIESTSGGVKFPDGTIQTTATAPATAEGISVYKCPLDTTGCIGFSGVTCYGQLTTGTTCRGGRRNVESCIGSTTEVSCPYAGKLIP